MSFFVYLYIKLLLAMVAVTARHIIITHIILSQLDLVTSS